MGIFLNFFYAFVGFVKVFLLFMAILTLLREAFNIYKSIAKSKDYVISKKGVLIVGMAFAYILTLIFI